MKTICFTSYSASGKTTVCQELSKNLGFPMIQFHTIAHDLAVKNGFDRIRNWIRAVGLDETLHEMREGLLLAIRTYSQEEGVLVDDIVDMLTRETLIEEFGPECVLTIYVEASNEDREAWYIKRNQGIDPETLLTEKGEIDEYKRYAGVGDVIMQADIVIKNSRERDLGDVLVEVERAIHRHFAENSSRSRERR